MDSEDIDDLIQEVFGELPQRWNDPEYTHRRAILTTTNEHVDKINEKVTAMLPGEVVPLHPCLLMLFSKPSLASTGCVHMCG